MVTAAPGPGLVAEAGNQGRKSLNYSGWCGAGPRYAWNGTKNLDHANYSEPAHCSPPGPPRPARRGAALANERPGGGHVTSAANGERGLGPGAVRPVQTRFRRSLTARGGQTGQYSPRCTQPTAESGKYFTPFVKKYYRNMFALCTKLCVSTVMRKCVPAQRRVPRTREAGWQVASLVSPPPAL